MNNMNNEKMKSDLLKTEADEFWANCESKAAELEVTIDYYLEEFYIYSTSLLLINLKSWMKKLDVTKS